MAGQVERVRVLGSLWKPHQSKELHFLNRSYTPKNFPTPKKILKIRDREKSFVFSDFFQWKSLKSHRGIPYTHRRESGNNTFQNMPKIFTGLENVFAGPGRAWKPHKSKDWKILQVSYTQIFFSTPKKIYVFFTLQKKVLNFFRFFLNENHSNPIRRFPIHTVERAEITLSEHATNLYRARKRVCRARVDLETP